MNDLVQRVDEGYITDKEQLPIHSFYAGDTGNVVGLNVTIPLHIVLIIIVWVNIILTNRSYSLIASVICAKQMVYVLCVQK